MNSKAQKTPQKTTAVSDLAIRDVQQRLILLGFDLGKELEEGLYGERTAAAVSAFKMSIQLPSGGVLDQATWIALVDASLSLGERALYLHMPYFHGRDVQTLQQALSALGFYCATNGVFDAATEGAVRDFQRNMSLTDNGIVSDETFVALERLRHSWEGKAGMRVEGSASSFMRPAAPLETYSICIYGTSEITRSIADRLSNLAHATTSRARVMNAALLARAPGLDVLLVGLQEVKNEDGLPAADKLDSTMLQFDGKGMLVHSLEEAIVEALKGSRRITIDTAPAFTKLATPYLEQHCAIMILDALCSALQYASRFER